MLPTATPIVQAVPRGAQTPDTSLLLCCIPPLLLIALGLVIYLWQREHRQAVAVRQHMTRLSDEVNRLTTQARDGLRLQWLLTLPDLTYRNEIEVEVKFIAPLVDYVGFTVGQVDLRVSVGVQVGRQTATGIADWVLWSPDHERPIVIVEAKAPGQSLNGAVQSQARSYAFALGAPLFLLTNGSRLQIYRRGVQTDQVVVDCTVEEMVEQWPNIVEALNRALERQF